MDPSNPGSSATFVQTPNTPAPTQAPSNALAVWPGAFGVFAVSRDGVVRNLLGFVLLAGPGYVLPWIAPFVLPALASRYGFMLVLACYILLFVLGLSTISLQIAAAKGEVIPVGKAFMRAIVTSWKFIVVGLVVGAMCLVSILLLVLPFFFYLFYVLPRLSLTPYFITDETKNMGPFAAMSASWAATKGNYGKVLKIVLVSMLLGLTWIIPPLGLILTVCYSAAFACLYVYATNSQAQQSTTPTPAPAQAQPADSAPAAA